jgi:hypothetical protein
MAAVRRGTATANPVVLQAGLTAGRSHRPVILDSAVLRYMVVIEKRAGLQPRFAGVRW